MVVKQFCIYSRNCLQVVCIYWCFSEYGYKLVKCEGISMEPTIRNNDIVLSSQWSVLRKKYRRGNIVIARSPDDPNRLICKRIVAVEGDKLGFGWSRIVIPKGHVWLEGDNKEQSNDSRKYGAVPIGLIKGKVIYRVHPFQEASKIE